VAGETFPKDIQLRTSLDNELWWVMADSTHLHQILLNLCVNARDAMPGGGWLTLNAGNVTLDSTSAAMIPGAHQGNYVRLTVSDTGSGMPPAVLEKIFEPFFTTKGVGQGTGLGLSTTLGIVKSHGGFLGVQSELGKGSCFTIHLPAASENQVPSPKLEANLPRGNGELVLVIDDEAAIRKITSETLQAFGYRVLTAGDGAEACVLFARHAQEIAVVLTDLMMPIMDGPATIRALRKMNPALPIIAVTGAILPHYSLLAQEAGVQVLISKPYRAEKLLNVLREILDPLQRRF
jgi:two-component system, cell cycle sensor histidine kinase and response regulator CckA